MGFPAVFATLPGLPRCPEPAGHSPPVPCFIAESRGLS
jgi:hypothetical protein